MWKPKLIAVIECLAWAEVLNCCLSIVSAIYALILASNMFPNPASVMDKEERRIENVLTLVTIKIIYFLIMYFVIETVVAIYLLHAVRKSILDNMRRWMIFGSLFTLICFTDFVSSLHAANFVEEATVTIGIVIKLPILILVWRYIKQLELFPAIKLENKLFFSNVCSICDSA